MSEFKGVSFIVRLCGFVKRLFRGTTLRIFFFNVSDGKTKAGMVEDCWRAAGNELRRLFEGSIRFIGGSMMYFVRGKYR